MIKAEMLANNYSIRTVQRYLPATAKESPKIPSLNRNYPVFRAKIRYKTRKEADTGAYRRT
jgi:hypothetical protein